MSKRQVTYKGRRIRLSLELFSFTALDTHVESYFRVEGMEYIIFEDEC